MPKIDTVIVGGGQAGLAMSYALSARGVEHVVLERGEIGQAWRDRWSSLTLLTPNWMNHLPGWEYRGRDPEAYMRAQHFAHHLAAYADAYGMPVETRTSVLAVEPSHGRFRVQTSKGTWIAQHVVVATGHCQAPRLPSFARHIDPDIAQITTADYSDPDALPAGGVLVVGASATGIQIADELLKSGREVTLAVGRHTRLPRMYRGRDILWWIAQTGKRCAPVGPDFDFEDPSPQLIGSADRRNIDLATIAARGGRFVGRVVDARGAEVFTADDLAQHVEAADGRMRRILRSFDDFAEERALDCESAEPIAPVVARAEAPTMNLRASGIRSIFWAVGYRRSYPWLRVPVLDSEGELRHQGGITSWPGLFALGLEYMRRRNSASIDGVGADAHAIAGIVAAGRAAQAAA